MQRFDRDEKIVIPASEGLTFQVGESASIKPEPGV